MLVFAHHRDVVAVSAWLYCKSRFPLPASSSRLQWHALQPLMYRAWLLRWRAPLATRTCLTCASTALLMLASHGVGWSQQWHALSTCSLWQDLGLHPTRHEPTHPAFTADRQQAVATFRDAPSVRVALLSVTAAGVGLDFSTASTVVFAGEKGLLVLLGGHSESSGKTVAAVYTPSPACLPARPHTELPSEVSLVRQAEDRAHRRGQLHAVNVYFLCAKVIRSGEP